MCNANSVDPDRTPHSLHSLASDLDQRNLSLPLLLPGINGIMF